MKVPQTPERKNAEQQALDVEIAFLEGIIRRDADYIEALQSLGDLYTKRGRIEDGLRVDLKLAELRPADPLVFYNLACSYSLANQIDPAFDALRKAMKFGYTDWKFLSEDSDLENLRKDPRFPTWIAPKKSV